MIDRDRLDVDVGTPAVDLLYDLRGFHASEREGDASGGTFRWTGSRASLTLPAGGAVTLVVAGARPPGAPPAEINVLRRPRRARCRKPADTSQEHPQGKRRTRAGCHRCQEQKWMRLQTAQTGAEGRAGNRKSCDCARK